MLRAVFVKLDVEGRLAVGEICTLRTALAINTCNTLSSSESGFLK